MTMSAQHSKGASPWMDSHSQGDTKGLDLNLASLSLQPNLGGGNRPPALSASSLSTLQHTPPSPASPSQQQRAVTGHHMIHPSSAPNDHGGHFGGGPQPSPIEKSGGNHSFSASPLIFDTSPSDAGSATDAIFASGGHHHQNLSFLGGQLPPPPPTLEAIGGRDVDTRGSIGSLGSASDSYKNENRSNLNDSSMAAHSNKPMDGIFSIAPRVGGGDGGYSGNADDNRSVSSAASGGGGGSSLLFANNNSNSFEPKINAHEDGLRGLEALRDRAQTAPGPGSIRVALPSGSSAPPPPSSDSEGHPGGNLHRRTWSTGHQLLESASERGGGTIGGISMTGDVLDGGRGSTSRLLSSSVDGIGVGGKMVYGRPPLASSSKNNLTDLSSSSSVGRSRDNLQVEDSSSMNRQQSQQQEQQHDAFLDGGVGGGSFRDTPKPKLRHVSSDLTDRPRAQDAMGMGGGGAGGGGGGGPPGLERIPVQHQQQGGQGGGHYPLGNRGRVATIGTTGGFKEIDARQSDGYGGGYMPPSEGRRHGGDNMHSSQRSQMQQQQQPRQMQQPSMHQMQHGGQQHQQHVRSYSHGSTPHHLYNQDHDGYGGGGGLGHPHQHPHDGQGQQQSSMGQSRHQYASNDGHYDAQGVPQQQQQQYYDGGGGGPRDGGNQYYERGRFDGGHNQQMPRSASSGSNMMGRGEHGREMPMRRSGSVPAQVMSSSTSFQDESVHGGERFTGAYGHPHPHGSNEFSSGDYHRDNRGTSQGDFHGGRSHGYQGGGPGQHQGPPHHRYHGSHGGITPVVASPEEMQQMMSYGDEYDVNGMRISSAPRGHPNRPPSPREQMSLGRGRSTSMGGEGSRHGQGVTGSHHSRGASYDPDHSQPLMGEHIEEPSYGGMDCGGGQRVQYGMQGQMMDNYHEPIVLPRYGVEHMPRPPATAPPGPGPKVVFNVKFKRTQRFFILGQRAPREIKIGTYVKVEADRGEDLGIIVSRMPAEKFNANTRSSFRLAAGGSQVGTVVGAGPGPSCAADLKRITRLATHDEVALLTLKREEEDELLKICRTKVRQRGLPMHVVDAEYQFDRHKLTFFFEAEGRIDFRELVRDLFSIYKTRIWMQQLDKNGVGVDSEGGIAGMEDFAPNSIEASASGSYDNDTIESEANDSRVSDGSKNPERF